MRDEGGAKGQRQEARGARSGQEAEGSGQRVVVFRARAGGIVRWPLEAASLDQVSAQLPSGAYTTLRTYQGGRVLRLDDHWIRLRDSALRLDPAAHVELGRADVAVALGQALARAGLAEARVRLTLGVPGGELFIGLERLDPLPAEFYERGVAVALCPFVPHATRAKSTASIAPLRGAKAGLPAWAHEGVMVDQSGLILEGLSSNFLAVKDGCLRTAGENVVTGTTRTLVLELAAGLLPVVLDPVGVCELGAVAECFITSVSREVLPVVRVGETTIGDGRPGAVTRELLRRFRACVRANSEPVC